MIRDKLNRLAGDIVKKNEISSQIDKAPERYHRISDILGGELVGTESGSFVKITTDFKDDYCHGRDILLNLDLRAGFQRRHFYYNQEEAVLKTKNLLFFDMETTGLGGAGTVPFLIGFGSVTDSGFQVRQYFLPDYPDEEAMLAAVREEINDETVIVSYNGRTFDMPILTDRLILHRVERNLTFADHIDLLHAARRMYRLRLKSCTLSNIEENILDFHRIEDIPGALVPAIYFNWLNYDEAGELAGVIKHNLLDIVSLFFLLHHFSALREEPEVKITEPDDVLSLAKIIQTGRDHREVCRTLETFDKITDCHDRFDILFFQSMAYKRSGLLEKAVSIWNRISESDCPERFSALIELAKYFEHKAKDCQCALDYAVMALDMMPEAVSLRRDLRHRIRRLNSKIGY